MRPWPEQVQRSGWKCWWMILRNTFRRRSWKSLEFQCSLLWLRILWHLETFISSLSLFLPSFLLFILHSFSLYTPFSLSSLSLSIVLSLSFRQDCLSPLYLFLVPSFSLSLIPFLCFSFPLPFLFVTFPSLPFLWHLVYLYPLSLYHSFPLSLALVPSLSFPDLSLSLVPSLIPHFLSLYLCPCLYLLILSFSLLGSTVV